MESCAPSVINNIIAFNSAGIIRNSVGAPDIHKDDIYANYFDGTDTSYRGWDTNATNTQFNLMWFAPLQTNQGAVNSWVHSDSCPAVAYGIVVVGAFKGDDSDNNMSAGVRAFVASTGEPIWSTNFPMKNVCATPVIYNNVVYCLDHSGKAYAFDASNNPANYGKPVSGWPVSLSGTAVADSSPAIATINTASGSTSYLIAGFDNNYNLYRVNLLRLTDMPAKVQLGNYFDSSPTIDDVNHYDFIYSAGKMHKVSIDPLIKTSDSEQSIESSMRSTAALAYNRLYLGADGDRFSFYGLNASDLCDKNRQEFVALGPMGSDRQFHSSAALTNQETTSGIIFVGNENGYLFALRTYDLSAITSIDTSGPIHSSPAVAYIPDEYGNLKRWVFITTRAYGGTLLAFKTN